jgi:hypothetical protein
VKNYYESLKLIKAGLADSDRKGKKPMENVMHIAETTSSSKPGGKMGETR